MHPPFSARFQCRVWFATIALLVSAFSLANSVVGEEVTIKPRAAKSVADSGKVLAVATHHQAGTIQVNAADRPQVKLACFCLTADDKILAGCAGTKGEIRVIDAEGKVTESWPIPVNPEAIFCRPDGAIFVAGDGQVLKLSSTGKVELSKQAPQAAALNEHPEKLREEVIAQVKEQAEQFGKQAEIYDKMIAQADKQIDSINEHLAAAEESSTASAVDSGKSTEKQAVAPRRATMNKQSLERRLAMFKNQKEQYAEAKNQFAEIIGASTTGELTDAQIDEKVRASMEYKRKASSISAFDGEVFLATHAAAGYGFEVWRMDDSFENVVKVVKDLSGCCGQMDVKVSKDGLFIAENSKHRVCHYDRDGKMIGAWGESARTGLDGFGSCCNPMNVAFGPSDAVYTAEDDTGRIKRYSADGKLLGLVGLVELKPGCKNCSIAVSNDGSHVYMLDITRNFIVRLDARPADEVNSEIEKMKNAPAGSKVGAIAPTQPASGGSLVIDGLRALFTSEK